MHIQKKQKQCATRNLEDLMEQLEADFIEASPKHTNGTLHKRTLSQPALAFGTIFPEISPPPPLPCTGRNQRPTGKMSRKLVRDRLRRESMPEISASEPPSSQTKSLKVSHSFPVAHLSVDTGPFGINPPVSVVDSILDFHRHNSINIECHHRDRIVTCRVPWLILLPLWAPTPSGISTTRSDSDEILTKILVVIKNKFNKRAVKFNSTTRLTFQDLDGEWIYMQSDKDLLLALETQKARDNGNAQRARLVIYCTQ